MASVASTNIVNQYYQGILRFTPPASLAAVYAGELDAGSLTTTQLQAQLLSEAQSSSIPALTTYDLMFNTTPSSGGLTYLTQYSTALQSGNYTFTNGSIVLGTTQNQYSSVQFSLQNVYVNLGATFGGSPTSTFATTYGSLDRATFINQIYTQIFGTAPAASTQSYLLSNFQYYLNYAGSEISARGAIAGLLLSVAESTGTGPYPAAANALLTASAVSLAASSGASDAAKYGTELIAGYGSGKTNAVVLTTAVDSVVGNLITGDLTPFLYNGIGPTLNVGDSITGSAGLTNNTFVINDQYGTGADIIPSGVTISNVQTIDLNTASNAGGAVAGLGVGSGVLDLTTGNTTGSPVTGVTTVNVVSAGAGLDNVRVDPGTVNPVNVTVNHQHIGGTIVGGGVKVLGGANVTVTDGDNAGAVTIGSQTITGQSGAALNPTGAIKVTEYGNDAITTFGGTTNTISDAGTGAITVGVASPVGTYPSDEPSGAVSITDTAAGTAGGIAVFGTAPVTTGGTTTLNAESVTISETSLLAGAITVGGIAATGGVLQAFAPGGAVNISVAAQTPVSYNYTTGQLTGTASGFVQSTGNVLAGTFLPGLTTINEIGGSSVNIATNANAVVVGTNASNGSTLVTNGNTTGNVTVTDTATASGFGGAGVTVFGGKNVLVSNAGGAVTIGSLANAAAPVAPTGTITVTDTAPATYDNVTNPFTGNVSILGGTTVSATSNSGAITVGSAAGMLEPTGTITTVDTAVGGNVGAADLTAIFGGTNVSATSANGSITIGAGTAASNPTGTVTATTAGVETGGVFASTTTVNGGSNVVINTTGAGGAVVAGVSATPVTGPVVINDTFSGTQNADNFTVVGGSTVNINTTRSSGNISVGAIGAATGALNSAGTALAKPAAYASGNVSIVNADVANTGAAGATTTYGTGFDTVNTNGSTNVAIVGGSGANITDEQTTIATGGAGAGSAIGTSTLSTVVLDHVEGTTNVTTNALATVYLIDDVAGNVYNLLDNNAAALSLVLNNDAKNTGSVTTVNDAKATAVTITDGGVASGTVALNAGAATSLTVQTGANLALNLAGSTALTSISALNVGTLALGNLSGDAVAITAGATSTGAISVTLNGATGSFTGGAGNDTVTLTQNLVKNTIKAGSGGSNTIIAGYAAAPTDVALGTKVSGFNVLGVTTGSSGTYDATGFNSLLVTGTVAAAINFINVSGAETISFASTDNSLVTLNTIATGSANQALTVNIGTDTVGTTTGTAGLTDNLAFFNTSSLTVNSFGKGGSTLNTLNIANNTAPVGGPPAVATNPTALTVTGDESITIVGTGNAVYSSISDAGTTGTGTVDASSLTAASNGFTATGGALALKATGYGVLDTVAPAATAQPSQNKETYTSGSGGATFTLGSGGGFNVNTPVAVTTGGVATTYYGAFDSGSETVNLTASVAKSDTLNIGTSAQNFGNVISTFNGTAGGVTGFQNTASTAADVMNFGAGFTVLANQPAASTFNLKSGSAASNMSLVLDPSGALANALAAVNYASLNGVITLTANGGAQTPSKDTLVKAAEIIVALAAGNSGVGTVGAISDGAGNTYVVSATGNNAFFTDTAQTAPTALPNGLGLSVVELLNTTNVSGFGTTLGATGAILTSAINAGFVQNASNTTVSATGRTSNETGFSRDVVGPTGSATFATVLNNLGTASELDINGGGTAVGTITTTQVGAAGGNSLVVMLNAADTISTLSTSGDWAVKLTDNAGGTTTIGKMVDATSSITNLIVTGGGTLNIGTLSGYSALTTIDASKDAGIFSVGTAANAAINNAGLVFKGATGGDTLVANGVSDQISVGSATSAIAGTFTITAAGNTDTVTLTNSIGSNSYLVLDGVGDTVGVDLGNNSIGGGYSAVQVSGGTLPAQGNGLFLSQALGGSATVNLAAGGFDTVWVGGNSTVNLTANTITGAKSFTTGAALVDVQGDTVGTTSAGFASGGSAAYTTITGVDTAVSANNTTALQLYFNNAANEFAAGGSMASAFVNIQGATSLSAALDAAVNQSLFETQQNGSGGTAFVNGATNLTAKTGLISWFQYAGNTYVVEATNSTSASATHVGLAAGDSVIKLTGLVSLAGENLNGHFLTGNAA